MKLNLRQKDNLSDYLVNLSSAWFIGGIVTPLFTRQENSDILILDIIIGFVLSITFLVFSWELFKNNK